MTKLDRLEFFYSTGEANLNASVVLIIYCFPADIFVQYISGYDLPLFAADICSFFSTSFLVHGCLPTDPWLLPLPMSPTRQPKNLQICYNKWQIRYEKLRICKSARKAANLH